jgi:hypothetical protein
MKLLILLVTFCSSSILFSQDKTLGFNIEETIKVNDSIQPLNFDTPNKGKITVIQDERIANITEFIGRNKESIEGPRIDGYRIQIFFAESRTIAQSQKASFMSAHNEHKAYIDYMAPNYRVRVGNFRTKLQAECFKQELISIYPTCIVLKDKIELPIIVLSQD